MNIDDIKENWNINFLYTSKPVFENLRWKCRIFETERWAKDEEIFLFDGAGKIPTEALNEAVEELNKEIKKEEEKKKGFKPGGIGLHFLIEKTK